ncbi:MAG: hypothetical protein H6963_12270 [Chromatiaceae bacterium]|nr:hypothetical protein [Chromatiaceae bacterium]
MPDCTIEFPTWVLNGFVKIKKLKAQVKRLEMERDILKKATAFFAAETK